METRLKAARRERGWSQLRLVIELERASTSRGVRPPNRSSLKTQVSRWENGHVQPDEFYASLFADVYGATPADLGLEVQVALWLPTTGTGVEVSTDLVQSLRGVLGEYARADNVAGPGHLVRLVLLHVEELERVASQARGTLRDQVLRLCSEFAEFAGWLYQDGGDLLEAERWTDRALDFIEGASDRSARAYLLMRKSAVAGDGGDILRSVHLAEVAARELDGQSGQVRALVQRQLAISNALVGNGLDSERASNQALTLVRDHAGQGDGPDYCTPSYILMETGAASFRLGDAELAAERLGEAVVAWPDGFGRDQGLAFARLAVVELLRGDVEAACDSGRRALELASSSARVAALVRDFNKRLTPHAASTVVQDFRSYAGLQR